MNLNQICKKYKNFILLELNTNKIIINFEINQSEHHLDGLF